MAGKCVSAVLLLALVVSVDGRAADPKEPALRQELLDLQKEDQEAKADNINVLNAKGISLQKASTITDPATAKLVLEQANKVAKIEQKGRTRLRKILDKHGWPGKSLVDTDGAEAAWYLAIQARKDLALQKRCLKLMKEAPKGEVQLPHVAQLTDTILVAEKKKQLYGTSVLAKGGVLRPYPIEDEDNLDKRRAEVGLPPMVDYLERAQRQYDEATGKR
jgi:hypothetical protein